MKTTTQLRELYQPKEIKVITADPQVTSARFSPCGKLLVAGGYDGRVRRWDVTGSEPVELSPLEGHGGWVQALAFHPGDGTLYSADSWGQLRAWPYADEQRQTKWSIAAAHDGWIRQLCVSPDGKLLASCASDRRVRVWSTADGKLQQEVAAYGEDIYCVRFHPDGKSLLTGDQKGIVKLWDLASGNSVRQFDASELFQYSRLQDVGGVRCLDLDGAGKRLACGGTKPSNGGSVTGIPTLLVFDFDSGELKHSLELGTTNDVYVCDVQWHAEGFFMAVTSGQPGAGKLLFQLVEEKEPLFVTTKMSNCHSLSLHPDGDRLAVVATNRNSNGNGRRLNKDGEYEGNTSPIHIFELTQPAV